MSTASMALRAPEISGDAVGASGRGGIRLQARFWRSPFAVAAAAVLAAQILLIAAAAIKGATLSYEFTFSLTAVSATLLAAGIWPAWNYLIIDEDGIDQQAGLRTVKIAWPDIQQIRAFDGWAEIRVIEGRGERFAVKRVPIFNRYDLSADAFAELIEEAWLRSRPA
jgi:hypothetical protein